MTRAVVLVLGLMLGATVSAWNSPAGFVIEFKETGVASKQYTARRLGSTFRFDGTFPVDGAIGALPHAEIRNATGSYLYVPSLTAALWESTPSNQDRLEAVTPVKVSREKLSWPAAKLSKEPEKTAKVLGSDVVAGRDTFVLVTSPAPGSVYQDKTWIDKEFGIALRFQRIEDNKVVFERVALRADFAARPKPDLFDVPKGTFVLRGTVTPETLGKLEDLGDEPAYNRAIRAQLLKWRGRQPLVKGEQDWVFKIVPPKGFKHSLTRHQAYTDGLAQPGSALLVEADGTERPIGQSYLEGCSGEIRPADMTIRLTDTGAVVESGGRTRNVKNVRLIGNKVVVTRKDMVDTPWMEPY